MCGVPFWSEDLVYAWMENRQDSWVLFVDVIGANEPTKTIVADLVMPWIVLYCIATVASIVSMYLKVNVLRAQIHFRREQTATLGHKRVSACSIECFESGL